MRKTSKIALCGLLAALGSAIMLLGGVFPLATFCCPAIASILLLPVLVECGRGMALQTYAVISLISVLLCADKEAAFLFVFLGYYPVLKISLDKIKGKPLQFVLKLLVFNCACALLYLFLAFILHLDGFMEEYRAMGIVLLAAFAVIGNVTMLLYDRMLTLFSLLYVRRFREKLVKRFH